ncbi:phenylalanine--tRNA ligase [Martiniozyma asiatica (nom. inval.)]|nr:phenylalanine--tRNA ligase [Martiniozyma asiatica]
MSLAGRIWIRCQSTLKVIGREYPLDGWSNTPPRILSLVGRNLHLEPSHPISILRSLIEAKFEGSNEYHIYNNLRPDVSVFQNFDVLGFPTDHVGRSKSDTYYINKEHLLRTHTSAHEHEAFTAIQKGQTDKPGYLITGDVYRRDEIDRTHYPVFHQMEGARVWKRGDFKSSQLLLEQIQRDIDAIPKGNLIVEDVGYDKVQNPKQDYMTNDETELVATHLKRTLELLVDAVFNEARRAAKAAGSNEPYLNEPLKVRWVEAYFPWTAPSWEIEVWWKGEWLEVTGCGVVRKLVLDNSGMDETIGWAFGVGLDRIAMLLFGIPDIRLFWSLDERFSSQFTQGKITTFRPYSKYPGCVKDVSFWLPQKEANGQWTPLHENDLMEIVREEAGDLVESVKLVDEFTHPKTGKKSQTYRINYQSMDRNVTNKEINEFQQLVRENLVDKFGVEMR